MQLTPPIPQALSAPPGTQSFELQHPVHDIESQMHAPAVHRWPVAHAPVVQTLLQPSEAPHGLPEQSGVQEPVPQMFGPPPPQV